MKSMFRLIGVWQIEIFVDFDAETVFVAGYSVVADGVAAFVYVNEYIAHFDVLLGNCSKL